LRGLLSHLDVLRYTITRSFWFLPGLMTLGAVILSVLTRTLGADGVVERFLVDHDLIAASPDSTRSILATTVGSIITVTSLVFSMVLVALSRAQQQLGPRLLQQFTGDTVNQLVLGAFVATFVHALLTLATTPDPIPATPVATTILMVLGCFVLLIYFLHHTARYMQADHVLARLRDELCAAIADTWRNRDDGDDADPAPPALDGKGTPVTAPRGGYIQSVDTTRLLAIATEHGLRLRMDYRPGHFVLPDATIGQALPAASDKVLHQIDQAIVVGAVRTAAQDLEFSIKAMAEIALRALSPGINDTYTALAAIDQLGAALALAMGRRPLPRALADAEGTVRLVCDRADFEGLLDAAYHPIRQNLAGNVTGLIRMTDMLGELAAFAREPGQARALDRHLDMLETLVRDSVADPRDGEDALARLVLARRAVAAGLAG